MRSFIAAAILFSECAKVQTAACAEGSACDAQGDEVAMLQIRLSKDGPAPASARRQKTLSSEPFMGGRDLDGETGKIKINEDGVINEYWLPGATTVDDFTTVKYKPPYRFYLTKRYTTDYSKVENFYRPNLIGKTFSVDINYGGADGPGCGCNLNFYMVDMPAKSAGKSGDYYCDAQCFEGLGCCPEWDMNEGNRMVEQITNHACTGDYPDHPDWACHKWGDPEDKTTMSDFSPGDGHTIDSNKPFTYEQEYREENGQAIVITRMKQGSSVLEKSMGPGSSQLNAMFKVIEAGMVFVTGYWFDQSMNWLDGEECGGSAEHCDERPAWIGNWKITTNGAGPAPGPTPAPKPTPPVPPAPDTKGKCFWESCNNSPINGWCSESENNCKGCGGGVWCNQAVGHCAYQKCDGTHINGYCSESSGNCAECGGGVWCK